MNIELKPCPFCGYGKIHLRRKSETRESVTGAKALITQAWGPDYEVDVADWRFGVKYYCGKCYASTGYQWGGWHVPTEGEIETYEDYLYNIPYQFDHYESRDEVIREAAEAWNTRAERTCRIRGGECDQCGAIIHEHANLYWVPVGEGMRTVEHRDVHYCPNCGAKVVE